MISFSIRYRPARQVFSNLKAGTPASIHVVSFVASRFSSEKNV
jgi:hypothetical protein